MFQDKTDYFLKIRQTPTKSFQPIPIDNIKSSIEALGSSISLLENKLQLISLPDFGSRVKKYAEIELLRNKIQTSVQEIEKDVMSFYCEDLSITDTIKQYFINKLRVVLIEYKNLEKNKPESSISDDSKTEIEKSIQIYNPNDVQLQESVERNTTIKTNIFNLTNTLIQLKIALKAQSTSMDTIDMFFDKSNEYLKQANKEIEKIPERYCGFKDYIIYVLLYTICILLCMILIKTYKAKMKISF